MTGINIGKRDGKEKSMRNKCCLGKIEFVKCYGVIEVKAEHIFQFFLKELKDFENYACIIGIYLKLAIFHAGFVVNLLTQTQNQVSSREHC